MHIIQVHDTIILPLTKILSRKGVYKQNNIFKKIDTNLMIKHLRKNHPRKYNRLTKSNNQRK